MGSHIGRIHWTGLDRGTEGLLAWRKTRTRALGAELDMTAIVVRTSERRQAGQLKYRERLEGVTLFLILHHRKQHCSAEN